jgi:hypothetical protein
MAPTPGPVPADDGEAVLDCWGIGEQEAGPERLVSALLRHQVAIDGTTRAEIAVVCEAWGMWPVPLGPSLSRCPDDGAPLPPPPGRGTWPERRCPEPRPACPTVSS